MAGKFQKKTKIPVSERAILQRINRALKPKGSVVTATRRGTEAAKKFGRFVLHDESGVERGNIELEKLARDLGAIKEWEVVAET